MSDLIDRQAAIDALWKALYEYEDKTEEQFLESEELDIATWFLHRIFVQNMNDIDRQTILNLPSVQPERKKGKWIQRSDMPWYCYCSNCHRVISVTSADQMEKFHAFCGTCGADMRKEPEDAVH